MHDTTWEYGSDPRNDVLDPSGRITPTAAEAPASAVPAQRFAVVSAVLRLIGAALVVASAATFMLRY